jgi:hypothetical protein
MGKTPSSGKQLDKKASNKRKKTSTSFPEALADQEPTNSSIKRSKKGTFESLF